MYIYIYIYILFKGGTTPETTKTWTHICSCHNFFPFACANSFDTSLLLIVCALRWYVKSIYRHFFLEDISKHARVTQKITPPICAKPNSQAPWPTRPKLGVRVAVIQRGVFCVYFYREPPELRCWKRRDQRNSRNFFDPASSQHRNSGWGGRGSH